MAIQGTVLTLRGVLVLNPFAARLIITGLVVVTGLSETSCAGTAGLSPPDDMTNTLILSPEDAPVLTATPTPEPTPTPTPLVVFDATEVLRKVGEEMEGLSSFHFRLSHEKGSTEISTGFYIEDAAGYVVKPDKMSLEILGRFGKNFVLRAQFITYGDRVYMTNPLSGKWEDLSEGVNPFKFFSPSKGVVSMMLQANDIHLLGMTEDGGAYRLEGTVPTSALSVLLGDTLRNGSVACELTVEVETMFLKEAKIVGKVTSSDQEEFVRVITLSAFNKPVSIEVPKLE